MYILFIFNDSSLTLSCLAFTLNQIFLLFVSREETGLLRQFYTWKEHVRIWSQKQKTHFKLLCFQSSRKCWFVLLHCRGTPLSVGAQQQRGETHLTLRFDFIVCSIFLIFIKALIQLNTFSVLIKHFIIYISTYHLQLFPFCNISSETLNHVQKFPKYHLLLLHVIVKKTCVSIISLQKGYLLFGSVALNVFHATFHLVNDQWTIQGVAPLALKRVG